LKRSELISNIKAKKSFLCVGLDSDINKIPKHLLDFEDPVLEFNRQIIDATKDFCVSYKINTAFYEANAYKGWRTMEKTLELIPSNIFSIADAKRGDIGNTSNMYADAFFKTLNFDAITLAPYMGMDSIKPFFNYEGKWGIVLALTSNPGSKDFEQQKIADSFLYEEVIRKTTKLAGPDKLMFVVGATKASDLLSIRKIAPDNFLLVPGVGAQGGSLEDVVKYGMNEDVGLLINASRSIIFAGSDKDFAQKASAAAEEMAKEMAAFL